MPVPDEQHIPHSDASASELDDEADRDELRSRYYGLLQELRVLLPGVQVLVAFMLAVPFAKRFSDLDSPAVAVFASALVTSMLSVVSFMTPISLHRFGMRTARSNRLQLSIVCTQVGILLLGVSMLLSLTLVLSFLFNWIVTVVLVGVTGTAMIGLWVLLPARLRAHDEP